MKDGSKDSPFKLPTLSPKEGLETFNASLSSGRRSTASWVSLSFVVPGPSPPESFQTKFEKDPRRKPQLVANNHCSCAMAKRQPQLQPSAALTAVRTQGTICVIWRCGNGMRSRRARATTTPLGLRLSSSTCGRTAAGLYPGSDATMGLALAWGRQLPVPSAVSSIPTRHRRGLG